MSPKYPLTFILAWIFLTAGAALLVGLVIVRPPLRILIPLAYVGFASVTAAAGEFFNHPIEKHRELLGDAKPDEVEVVLVRRRNSCSLGHLFNIVAILLFFVGLAKFTYGP